MPSERVVRHFESAAADYSTFRKAWPLSFVRRQELQGIAEVMPVATGDRVLDAGCGDGELLRWLTAAGARPIGIDIAFAMAAECRRDGLRVSVQDLEHPAFKPLFDWVLCFGALEFTVEPGRAIAALAASLRPGGRLVLLYPNQSVVGHLYAAYHRFTHGMNVHLFRRTDIATWIDRAGLLAPTVWRTLSLSTLCVAQRPGADRPIEAMRSAEPGTTSHDWQIAGSSSQHG